MKQLPKYIVEKIERANKLALEAEKLNTEVEQWLESNGVEDAYDLIETVNEPHGYTVDVRDIQWVLDSAQ